MSRTKRHISNALEIQRKESLAPYKAPEKYKEAIAHVGGDDDEYDFFAHAIK